MDRKLVKQRIKQYTEGELKEWRNHAVKCLNYYLKYKNDFEMEECNFVILHIDKRLKEIKDEGIL